MELKEFIKSVVREITDAVKESQEEIKNGAIICPTNYRAQEIEKLKDSDGVEYVVSVIDFDVHVYAEKTEDINTEVNAGVSWLIAVEGKGEVNDVSKSGNATRIRFKIPVVMPSTKTIQGFRRE